MASSEGVRVLSVMEEGGYRCEEDALRRVTSCGGGAARALPVAVVSVAGATRGGKSFLLDFFLRYLRAPEAARRSDAWLGADDEPLIGFSWRGGCERHTEGILVWSEPIIITLGAEGKNEQVAVVLLDTQGSFDSSSTMRDSSTVFALSTLLSSIQIYNLSQNIKEDDLHYLQLFTEYGKLARDEGAETPFQELWFLIRDWCFAYDHPFGAEGGQQLLDKRLEIRAEQASELREIRSQVRGAFERVRGFLMPHPGLTVAASPTFTGCLKDISTEFKNALLELVPALFAPENLKIKHINGQALTLQDFAHYFKTYVEIFNSDTLPTPVTVFQATSAANLEAALSACREEYVSQMERSAGGASCVPRHALANHHAAALAAARHAFSARRTLATPAVAAARLHTLLEDLDLLLADYEAINSGRILEAAARCKAMYEERMQTDECLTDDELTEWHNTAVATVKKRFHAEFMRSDEDTGECNIDHDNKSEGSNNCSNEDVIISNGINGHIDSEEDDDGSLSHEENGVQVEDDNEDWKTLEKDLAELLPLHRERNVARVTAAQESAHETYTARMREAVSSAPCLHPNSLRALHEAAVEAVAEQFLRVWHDADTVPQQLREELSTYMEEKYSEFEANNNCNNEVILEEALNVYKNKMSEICDGPLFLHPSDLKREHELAEEAAEEHFLNRRDASSRGLPPDIYLTRVHRGVIPFYFTKELRNETRNKEAVKEAHEHYLRCINPAGSGNGVLDLLGPPDTAVLNRHPRVKEEAIDQFKRKRRATQSIQDYYLDDLVKKIEKSFSWIKFKIATSFTTTAVGAIAMGATMMFAGRRLISSLNEDDDDDDDEENGSRNEVVEDSGDDM